MDAWSCFSCGAVIKQKEAPSSCPFCNRKQFFEHMVIEEKRDEASRKYEEALKKLEEYDKDIPKMKLMDYVYEYPK